MARSKISFSIEIFNLDRNLEFFWSLGPLGIFSTEGSFGFESLEPYTKLYSDQNPPQIHQSSSEVRRFPLELPKGPRRTKNATRSKFYA